MFVTLQGKGKKRGREEETPAGAGAGAAAAAGKGKKKDAVVEKVRDQNSKLVELTRITRNSCGISYI